MTIQNKTTKAREEEVLLKEDGLHYHKTFHACARARYKNLLFAYFKRQATEVLELIECYY